MSANLRELMALEDQRCQEEIRGCAELPPDLMNQAIADVMKRSKERQRVLFKKHWGHEEPTADNDEPVYRLHYPSPDYRPPAA